MNDIDARYIELVDKIITANQQYENTMASADYTTVENANRSRVLIHKAFDELQTLMNEYTRILPNVSYDTFNNHPKPYLV